MKKEIYKKQVALLLTVLPEVAREKDLAIHGGTAINLFIRNMPRLSVNVDLTYIPIEDRATSMVNITAALKRIQTHIQKVLPQSETLHKEKEGKLLIAVPGATIKLEVNLTNRGTLVEPITMQLCKKAQDEFDAFCTMQIVPIGQLYGGKICAALSRQHPRDIFDVKYLLKNEGFTEQVKQGFLLLLLSSERPINEILNPRLQDQRSALINQFAGMTNEGLSYEDFQTVRNQLITTVRKNLTEYDKHFLLNIKDLTPDWSVYNFQHFPAVKWKMQNIRKLKEANPKKHQELYAALKSSLNKFE